MKFIKSIGVYTIVNILDKAIPFLMLPILTKYLSPNDFGMVAMYLVFISFIYPFVGLNIHGAITRQYIDKEKVDMASYLTNAMYILLVTSILIYICFFIFDNVIENYFHISNEWFFIVISITISMVISEIVLSIYNISHKPIHYGFYRITRTVVTYSFIIFLVVYSGKEWEGRVIGQQYGEIVLACVGLFLLFKANLIKFTLNMDYIKNALQFGIPLIPHAFGAVIISMSDRLLITNLVGLDATGVYVVAVQISIILSVVIGSIKQAWTPYFFEKIKLDTDKSKKEIVKSTYIIIAVLLALTLLFSLLIQPIIPFLVDEKFVDSKNYITWIVLGFTFQATYYLFTNYIFYKNKTYILMLLTVATSVINIVCSYFLIQLNGTVGAAQGTLIAYALVAFFTVYISSKIYPMPWNILNSYKGDSHEKK